MKRLLLITLDFWPNQTGGVATYYAHICKYLVRYTDLTVLTLPLKKDAREIHVSYTIIRKPLLARWMYPRWIRAFWDVFYCLQKRNIQYVLVGQLLPLGTVMWLLSYILPISYGVFVHGMDVAQLQGRKRWLARQIFTRSRHIFCNSVYTKQLVTPYTTQEKIHCIFPCPNERLFQNPVSVSEHTNIFTLLTVARLVRRKGIHLVLEAIALLKQQGHAIQYSIVGNGPELDFLQRYTKHAKLESIVTFFTHVSDAELPLLYKKSDVFIMTPIDEGNGDVEGFGIVYLEANAFGKPVIASQTGGVGEAVISEKTGLLLGEVSKESIAKAILHLMKNDDIRKGLGEYGKQRVKKEFSWEKQVETFKEILV